MTDLDEARRLLAAGERAAAHHLLRTLVRATPQHGETWWLLSTASDDPVEVAQSADRAGLLGFIPPATLAALDQERAAAITDRAVRPPRLAGAITTIGAATVIIGTMRPWIIRSQGEAEHPLASQGPAPILWLGLLLVVVGIGLWVHGHLLWHLAGWILGVLTGALGVVLLAGTLFTSGIQLGRAERNLAPNETTRLVIGHGPSISLGGLVLVLVGCSLPPAHVLRRIARR